ncbi:MAG TPA: PIN domain-containing protein [Longimicrobium sp.]|nr:PIN domain-containing protein [Longimicrobium sp.]
MTRERIFIDTWFILALLNARDADHDEAKRLLPRIRSAATLVTTDAILLEACNGLAKYNRAGAAQFARTCYRDATFQVIQVDRRLVESALRRYEGVSDKDWGLTDCLSFVVHARTRGPARRDT